MTTANRETELFADVAGWLSDQLHPKGSPQETTPLRVTSIEGTAQRFVGELKEQALGEPLMSLLNDLRRNPAVDGVALVVSDGSHLSIRVLTDLSGDQEDTIGPRYDVFAQSLYDAMPRSRSVAWNLGYCNTAGEDVRALVSALTEDISREVHVSLFSFVMFERPTSTAT